MLYLWDFTLTGVVQVLDQQKTEYFNCSQLRKTTHTVSSVVKPHHGMATLSAPPPVLTSSPSSPRCFDWSICLARQSAPQMTNCVLILSRSIDVQLLWHISLRLSIFGLQCDRANWWFPPVCGTWFTFTWRKERVETQQEVRGKKVQGKGFFLLSPGRVSRRESTTRERCVVNSAPSLTLRPLQVLVSYLLFKLDTSHSKKVASIHPHTPTWAWNTNALLTQGCCKMGESLFCSWCFTEVCSSRMQSANKALCTQTVGFLPQQHLQVIWHLIGGI